MLRYTVTVQFDVSADSPERASSILNRISEVEGVQIVETKAKSVKTPKN